MVALLACTVLFIPWGHLLLMLDFFRVVPSLQVNAISSLRTLKTWSACSVVVSNELLLLKIRKEALSLKHLGETGKMSCQT